MRNAIYKSIALSALALADIVCFGLAQPAMAVPVGPGGMGPMTITVAQNGSTIWVTYTSEQGGGNVGEWTYTDYPSCMTAVESADNAANNALTAAASDGYQPVTESPYPLPQPGTVCTNGGPGSGAYPCSVSVTNYYAAGHMQGFSYPGLQGSGWQTVTATSTSSAKQTVSILYYLSFLGSPPPSNLPNPWLGSCNAALTEAVSVGKAYAAENNCNPNIDITNGDTYPCS